MFLIIDKSGKTAPNNSPPSPSQCLSQPGVRTLPPSPPLGLGGIALSDLAPTQGLSCGGARSPRCRDRDTGPPKPRRVPGGTRVWNPTRVGAALCSPCHAPGSDPRGGSPRARFLSLLFWSLVCCNEQLLQRQANLQLFRPRSTPRSERDSGGGGGRGCSTRSRGREPWCVCPRCPSPPGSRIVSVAAAVPAGSAISVAGSGLDRQQTPPFVPGEPAGLGGRGGWEPWRQLW